MLGNHSSDNREEVTSYMCHSGEMIVTEGQMKGIQRKSREGMARVHEAVTVGRDLPKHRDRVLWGRTTNGKAPGRSIFV